MAGELGRELQFEREWQVAVDRLVHSYQSESFGGFSAVYCRQCDKIISSFGFTTHGKRCESCDYSFHRGCALRRICPNKLLYDNTEFLDKFKVAALCDGLLDPRMFENAPIYGNLSSFVFDEPREHSFKPYSASLTAPTGCTVCGKKLQSGLKCGVCKYHVHKDCSEKAIKGCRAPVASIGELQKSIDASAKLTGHIPGKEPHSAGLLSAESSSHHSVPDAPIQISRSQGSSPVKLSPPPSPIPIGASDTSSIPHINPTPAMSPRPRGANSGTLVSRVGSKDSRASRGADLSSVPLDELYDIPPAPALVGAICTLAEQNEWDPELRILASELGDSVKLRIDAVVAILVRCRGDINASIEAILEDPNIARAQQPQFSNSPALLRQWAPELRQLEEMGFDGEDDYHIALLIDHNGDVSRVASILTRR